MNINDHVHVKLTAAGARVAALAGEDPRQERWQLWHLMQVFGPEIHMGQPEPYFERNQVVLEAESERDTARAFHEVECQRTVEAVERMIAAERSELALQARVARAVALLERAYDHRCDALDCVAAALEALR